MSRTEGIYNATAPVLNDGGDQTLQLDNAANLKVTQATTLAGEDITNDVLKTEQRFSYSYLDGSSSSNTATTTVVKSGAGFLHAVNIVGVTTAGTVTLYDNTAGNGTGIAAITGAAVSSYPFNVSFGTGLTVGVLGTLKVVISYR